MERIVEFSPAWDRRDLNPEKNYGIHCVEMRMVLKGRRGAVNFTVNFTLFTGWYLPENHVAPNSATPNPADFGYHSLKPQYDGQSCLVEDCKYLDGKPCYYDGSGLYAEKVFDRLIHEGDAAVWQELEDYYKERFGELD